MRGTRSVNGSLKPPGGAGKAATSAPAEAIERDDAAPFGATPTPGSVTKT